MHDTSHATAIRNVEGDCFEGVSWDPLLSNILLAKLFYAEGEMDRVYECLTKAIMRPVRTIDVNQKFATLI